MAIMREAWTDERLDDLAQKMDRDFDKVHTDIRDLRSEMNTRFDRVDARFDAMQRTMILSNASIVIALVGAIFAKGLL